MQTINKIYREIVELYLSILSLPMVYRPKSKNVLYFILVMLLFSIVFNTGLYLYFNSTLLYLFVYASVFNIFFLKFNFIIRIFNVFYKSIIYFYNIYRNGDNINTNVPSLNVLIFYYLYNMLCFVLTILIVVRLQHNLYEFNYTVGENTYIYSIFISPLLALMYIDYISEDEIKYKRVLLNNLGKLIHLIIISSATWSVLILFTNLLIYKPILCDTTGSDNHQTNQNTQHNDTTNNSQTNGNSQTSNINNTKEIESVTIFPKKNTTNQTNVQANINMQCYKHNTGDNNQSKFKWFIFII
uniref:hypothetical protein n=1 Tax=Porodaedalea chrysoloma TaxID=74615 RepID=UPI0023AA4C1D|nr:hypothetical protein P1S03_mgp08 [Porodaedalea chrysoloma]WCF76798.1 hypothetical protein [Porodaedalea chrysoloma]